jgi:hypothetical protein
MRTRIGLTTFVLAAGLVGCGGGGRPEPAFADLHPVKGVVKRGGQPVSGGQVRFNPDPDKGEFIINSEIGSDGSYTLGTTRSTGKNAERKAGAPAGKYTVVYLPSAGDQTAGGSTDPVTYPKPVTVNAGPNDIAIDLPAAGKK